MSDLPKVPEETPVTAFDVGIVDNRSRECIHFDWPTSGEIQRNPALMNEIVHTYPCDGLHND